MSYKVELVNKSLEFCTFNLWACAIPKDKISVFVFADNFTQLIFSDILGGLCFVSIGLINELFPWELGIVWQALIGGTLVTCLEFITGVIVNIWLKLGVWDYSGLPLNIMGQVCLPFYFAWVGLSVVAIVFDDYLRYWFFGEEKPHYKIV